MELPWIGSGKPGPHAWQEKQASSVAGSGNRLRPKKPASSLLQAASPAEYGVHRSPPAADLCLELDGLRHLEGSHPRSLVRSGRPSGLLSGCPPIDTRPQARANMGKAGDRGIARSNQEKICALERFGGTCMGAMRRGHLSAGPTGGKFEAMERRSLAQAASRTSISTCRPSAPNAASSWSRREA